MGKKIKRSSEAGYRYDRLVCTKEACFLLILQMNLQFLWREQNEKNLIIPITLAEFNQKNVKPKLNSSIQ